MFSVSAQPKPMRDRAVDLAAALHRVDQPPDIGGMHAVQDADLAGDAMHGEPNAMHVEGDGARREIGLALGLEAMAARRVPAACSSASGMRRLPQITASPSSRHCARGHARVCRLA